MLSIAMFSARQGWLYWHCVSYNVQHLDNSFSLHRSIKQRPRKSNTKCKTLPRPNETATTLLTLYRHFSHAHATAIYSIVNWWRLLPYNLFGVDCIICLVRVFFVVVAVVWILFLFFLQRIHLLGQYIFHCNYLHMVGTYPYPYTTFSTSLMKWT